MRQLIGKQPLNCTVADCGVAGNVCHCILSWAQYQDNSHTVDVCPL